MQRPHKLRSPCAEVAPPKSPHAKPRRSVLFHPRVFIASAPGQCHKKGGCLPAFFNQPVQHGRFSIGNQRITRQAGIRQAKHALPVLQHFLEGVEKRLSQQICRPRIGTRKFAGQRAKHGVQRGLKVTLPRWPRRQQRGQLQPVISRGASHAHVTPPYVNNWPADGTTLAAGCTSS